MLSSSELADQLQSQFELVSFEDLADVVHQHQTTFDFIRKLRKGSFENQERLVLYTSHDPSQAVLDHVQRAAAKIDISNFFILIVCPYDLSVKLLKANERFGHDSSAIQCLIVPLVPTADFSDRTFYSMDSLCPLAFMHLQISAQGDVRPCCKFKGKFGTLSDHTIQEIFTGTKAESLRNQMRDGIRPSECSECWKAESLGTTSYRQMALDHYPNYNEDWIENSEIRDLTWSPVSLCNFTCRICNEGSSSSIAVEEIKFSNDATRKQSLQSWLKKSNDLEQTQVIINQFDQGFEGLDYLHLLGGEPFLWPQLEGFVQRLIANGQAEKIALEINTNCSGYVEEKINLITQNFRSVDFLLSVDNIGQRFEMERGGQWSAVCANVVKFAALNSQSIRVKLAVTVNLQNVLYLDDVIDFAAANALPILWWYLDYPTFLSIDRTTRQTKQAIISKYQHHHDAELRSIAHRVAATPDHDGQEFIEFCKKLDQRRGQRFSDSHREIFQAMGG